VEKLASEEERERMRARLQAALGGIARLIEAERR